MKKSTGEIIDNVMEQRKRAYIQALADQAMREYVKGQAEAMADIHAGRLTPEDWMVINKAALEYHREYSRMLEQDGATMINGRKVPWMSDMSRDARVQVSEIIKRGIEEGKPTGIKETGRGTYPKGSIAEELHQYFDDQKSHASMVARSEVTRIQNVAKMEKWQDHGFERVGVLDDEGPNSCDPCAVGNGQVWTIAYALTHEKQHPNCVRRFRAARNDEPLTPEDELPDEPIVYQAFHWYEFDPDQPRDETGKWSDTGAGGGAGAVAAAARSALPSAEAESTAPSTPAAPAAEKKTERQQLSEKAAGYKKKSVEVHGHSIEIKSHTDIDTDKIKVQNALATITPEQAPHIKAIEVHPRESQYDFTVGTDKFKAAGEWDNQEKAIRIFGEDNLNDRLVAHEAAHAEFDAIESKERELNTIQDQEKGIKAFEEMETKRKAEVNRVLEKYQVQLEQHHNDLQAVRQQERDYQGSIREPGYQELRKKEASIKRRWTMAYRKQEKEIASVRESYDPEKEYDRVAHPERELRDAGREFQDAVQAEGGVTPYADSYVKSGHLNYRTEAFAALREREAGVGVGAYDWRYYQEKYPRSTAAYTKLKDVYKRKQGATR